jgi:hypothetical protein
MPKRKHTRRLWLPGEERVLGRYARRIVEGHYDGPKAALPDTLRELKHTAGVSARSADTVRIKLGEVAREYGWSKGAPRYSAAELVVLRRMGRAIVRGRYASAAAAVPDCRRALADAGLRSDRPSAGLVHALWEAARAMGWEVRRWRWRPDEGRISDRFARAVAAGRYRDATAAVPDCRRALSRLGPVRFLDSMIQTRVARRAHNFGRPKVTVRWTTEENAVINLFAQAVADGRYAGAGAAVRDCGRELERVGGPCPRPPHGIQGRLAKRAHEVGWTTKNLGWTEAQGRVIDRFSLAVVNGRYRNIRAATRDCRNALRSASGPVHGEEAVTVRIARRAHALGLPTTWLPLPPRIRQGATRFAEALVRGEYRTAMAAARACRAELGRSQVKPPGVDALARAILGRAHGLGMGPRCVPFGRMEKAAFDRFAQGVVDGRYRSVTEAARQCLRAMARSVRSAGGSQRPGRSFSAVNTQIHRRVVRFGPRPHSQFSVEELVLVDRFARAAVAHEYISIRHAASACQEAIGRLVLRGRPRSPSGRSWSRPLNGVHHRLIERVHEIGRFRVGHRAWEKEETRVCRRWVSSYRLYLRGRSRLNLATAAEMMRAELDRLGFYRTTLACVARIARLSRA